MTTETTDPLETVMEAATRYASSPADPQNRERLRLHVQLALARARIEAHMSGHWEPDYCPVDKMSREIAALEARLQED